MPTFDVPGIRAALTSLRSIYSSDPTTIFWCVILIFFVAARVVRITHPFTIHAWVLLPDHLHCVIELPIDDADFAVRWRWIKIRFSTPCLGRNGFAAHMRRGERGFWQRRYREYLIRDDRDFAAHMDYVHINPLKHGLVRKVID